jgi:N-acyl-D-amino-acid deacylase
MPAEFDILIQGGTLYDGIGQPGRVANLGITGDRIVDCDAPNDSVAATRIDATGLAVAPGFINMLSWAGEALLYDGRSQSDIRQGVTLEVLGEGWSMGPWTDQQKRDCVEQQGDVKFDVTWTTLGEYLSTLETNGVSCNVCSFVGATTLRVHEVGYENRPPRQAELERMTRLCREAMEQGAVGISTALVYAPSIYAPTDEIVALCKVAAEFDGLYASHIRNEADTLLEAFDEFEQITRESGVRSEVYHIKASGKDNWPKMAQLLERIEACRSAGLPMSADMYPYHASSSGLDACTPPWVQEGGNAAWIERMGDPDVRKRVIDEMQQPSQDWDNFYYSAGAPENIVLVGFKVDALKPLAGRTLADVAAERGVSGPELVVDLCCENGGNVGAAFFSMNEDNVRLKIQRPWISFCSDAQSVSAEGVFLNRSPHPRTYGTFARVLGKYVREEELITLEEAVHRLSGLPANNLRLEHRGLLEDGFFADVVVFDPNAITDNATFARPHQYATGMQHVIVNGKPVIVDGEHNGSTPGRFVRPLR